MKDFPPDCTPGVLEGCGDGVCAVVHGGVIFQFTHTLSELCSIERSNSSNSKSSKSSDCATHIISAPNVTSTHHLLRCCWLLCHQTPFDRTGLAQPAVLILCLGSQCVADSFRSCGTIRRAISCIRRAISCIDNPWLTWLLPCSLESFALTTLEKGPLHRRSS